MFDEITHLLFEHRVVVCDSNELVITKAFGIRDIRLVGVSGLTELSDNQWLVKLDRGMSVTTSTQIQLAYIVFFKERFEVAIAVDVDLGHGVEY